MDSTEAGSMVSEEFQGFRIRQQRRRDVAVFPEALSIFNLRHSGRASARLCVINGV